MAVRLPYVVHFERSVTMATMTRDREAGGLLGGSMEVCLRVLKKTGDLTTTGLIGAPTG